MCVSVHWGMWVDVIFIPFIFHFVTSCESQVEKDQYITDSEKACICFRKSAMLGLLSWIMTFSGVGGVWGLGVVCGCVGGCGRGCGEISTATWIFNIRVKDLSQCYFQF